MNTVIYLENALCPADRRIERRAGSVRELAPQDWTHPFVAFVDGRAIVRAEWDMVLTDDQVLAFIDVAAIPQGGGGGGSDPLRTVMMLAVLVAAPLIAASMIGVGESPQYQWVARGARSVPGVHPVAQRIADIRHLPMQFPTMFSRPFSKIPGQVGNRP